MPEEFYNFGESRAVCLEVLDELLSKAVGVHILEPIVSFKDVTTIRPTFTKSIGRKPRQAEAIGIMNKVDEKRAKESSSR